MAREQAVQPTLPPPFGFSPQRGRNQSSRDRGGSAGRQELCPQGGSEGFIHVEQPGGLQPYCKINFPP